MNLGGGVELSKEIFGKCMEELVCAYEGKGFAVTTRTSAETRKRIMDVWYDYLKQWPDEIFSETVTDWIRTYPNSPTIAELDTEARVLDGRKRRAKLGL